MMESNGYEWIRVDDADEDEDNDHAWLISHGSSWGLMTHGSENSDESRQSMI